MVEAADVPGGPFTQAQIDAAAAQIRGYCGWHIAPERTDTVRLDSDGAAVLRLPTLKLIEVIDVQDAAGNPITGWLWSDKGMLHRPGGFPAGFGAVTVTMRHGYEDLPPDLLTVLSGMTSRRVVQESLGARSVTFAASADTILYEAPLARYKLGPRP